MSNPFNHSRIQLVNYLLICLLGFITCSMHAQNVGIGTTNPTYQLTLGGTSAILGVENGGVFMAKNNAGVYEPFLYPRYIDNRTLMNYGTGGFQIRDMTYTTRFQITNDGMIGIGTSDPWTKLHVEGQVTIQDGSEADGKVLTSNAWGGASWQTPETKVSSTISNVIPKWNGTTLVDGVITDDGTNVGIGASSPDYKLTIGGTENVLGVENGAVFSAKNYEGNYEPFFYPRYFDNRTLMNYGTGGFQIRDMTYTTRFQITNSGNVGINTTSPGTSLHVVGQVTIQDGTQAQGKVLVSNASGVASWQTPPAGVETDPKVASSVSNCVPKWNGTALTDGLIFDNGTNVGIGTLAPTAKLHVNGSICIADGTQGVGKVLSSDATGLASWITNPGYWTLSGDNIYLNQSGNIGIGTSSPTSKLHLSSDAKLRIDGGSDDISYFSLGGNGIFSIDAPGIPRGRFVVNNDGNVGIGTANPTNKLHVVGGLRIENGTQGIGRVLTSDAFGVATWQTPSAGPETDPQVASGIFNCVPKWNGLALTDGSIFDNGTNVGIGTTSPGTKLHVVGQLRIEDGLQGVGKVLMSNAVGVASWQNETDPQVTSITTNRVPKWDGTALVDGTILDNGTNVGIGTDSPSDKLHIVSSGTSGNAGSILLNAPSMVVGSATVLKFGKNGTTGNQAELRFDYEGDNNANSRYEFGFANIQPFVAITAGQKVGIGTLAPTATLHVNGSMRISDGSQGAGKVLTSDIDGVAGWQTLPAVVETDPQVGSATINKISKWNGSALVDGIITDNGTNVGIGAANPMHQLTLGGTDVVFGVENASVFVAKNNSGVEEPYFYPRWSDNRMLMNYGTGGFQMRDNAFNVRFQITNTGNVGVGTGAPNGLFELTLDQGRKPSTSTWTITSDARVKNIEGQYTKGLNEIIQLNPILYHYKNTGSKTFSPEVLATENVGLTAQEVQQVFPEAVGVDPDGTLNLNMHPILIAQLNAIKELNAMVVNLQQQVDALTAKLNEK